MVTFTLSLYGEGTEPRVKVVTQMTGALFITLRFGDQATVIFPGVNAEAVSYARSVINALESAIAELDPRDEAVGLGEQPVVEQSA